MSRGRSLYGLDLNNNWRIDQGVDAQTIFEPETVVLERCDFLPLDLKAAPLQIAIQNRLVYGFEWTRT